MNKSISIICATIDNMAMVERHFRSIELAIKLSNQRWKCEFILIDQTINADSKELYSSNENVKIRYLHSEVLGLSVNRNKGLSLAKFDWLLCSDADCIFDENFFIYLDQLINEFPDRNLFIGRILSSESLQSLFRRWPNRLINVTKFHRWRLVTSVNCIWKKCDLRFDSNFGLGAMYGSCEDVDFFTSMKGFSIYSPYLKIYHPEQDITSVNIEKLKSYSIGFGALCRKHLFNYGFYYFIASFFKKIYELFSGTISLSKFSILCFYRIKGFFSYIK
jgi:glycosyltransferase involved in cell wall biosynthesis